uniref:uncharacterized protein LOC120954984 n=1 Tax=Anopheles coluzzii TaxID=1518534 RepID=UPI0020FFB06C|nr:uncharacterized protein LOC120954984 [Anopheles coluzzii]
MGNSGSMSGLSGYEEGYHHHPGYHHHHQRYHDAMRGESGMAASWMDSYQRDHHRRPGGGVGPRDHDPLQQQIKVLPDIPGKVAKLRSTNNGSILHAGGTISKNNQALQRSKSISSPTYQQHQQQHPASFSECDEELELSSLQPARSMLMQRSRTQLNLMPPGLAGGGAGRLTRNGHAPQYGHDEDGGGRGPPERAAGGRQTATRYGEPNGTAGGSATEALNQRKRFGSEPDLRLSLLPRSGPGPEPPGGSRNPKMAQSKIMKGKNKKKAPVPPVMEKRDASKDADRQRIIAYSPMRKPDGNHGTSTLPSSSDGSSFNVAATRKLRLFKTRAETKKTPTIAKLPEASDAKMFPGKSGPPAAGAAVPAGGSFMRAAGPHQRPDCGPSPDDEKLGSALEHISPRPNPTSFFRREKTFDAGLLGLERQREAEARPAAKPTMSPPLSRRKSLVKSYLEQHGPPNAGKPSAGGPARVDVKPRQQVGTPAESYQRKLALAEAQRKQSSAAAAAITDFQKELQLATRRKPGPAVAAPPQAKPAQPAGSRFSLLPGPAANSTPTKAKHTANALVINVEPAKDAEPKSHDTPRDSPPPATPPPPPPPPKTSFYFGMRDDREPQDVPRRFTGQTASRPTVPFMAESRVDDSDDSERDARPSQQPQESRDGRESAEEEEEHIGHTQMELIDQFAASLLNSSRFRSSDSVASSEADVRTTAAGSTWDEADAQEIALKLRPTLPRKQFDIPRFSPAAAWRLLTTEDEFCREAGGVPVVEGGAGEKKHFLRGLEQELDVPEDRIQRVYREPGVPGLQDNKSGDSGISGDAGDLGQDGPLTGRGKAERAGDTSPESGTPGLHKPGGGGGGGGGAATNGGWSSSALLLMPWTPQQDLDDDEDDEDDDEEGDEQEDEEDEEGERGGGGGEDDRTMGSGGEARRLLAADAGRPDYSSKGHLFSLSLPRENHLSIYNVESADEKVEKHVFNSLQKFRKSVTGAFKSDDSSGQLDSNDSNWFLGRLDTKLTNGVGGCTPAANGGAEKRSKLLPDGRDRDVTDGAPAVSSLGSLALQHKHSSIGYLVSGKHMMYLPKEPTKLHATNDKGSKQDENNNRKSYHNQNGTAERHQERAVVAGSSVAPQHGGPASRATTGSRGHSDKENLQDPVPISAMAAGAASTNPHHSGEFEAFPVKLTNRRNHRFTFQSTIRQIEKRRVAEKLSREAEIKEAMRLSELEAMRRVEEEFQKKRAREKASIRHQLRLFSMENHPDHPGNDGEGEQDSTGDTKRSDPDGDSLPHQSASGRSGGGGLYRKKEFTSMERQYKRSNGTGHGAAPEGGEELDGEDEMLEKVLPDGGTGRRRRYGAENEDDNDDDEDDDGETSSSLGYVDTRTPYISRIIQAKSSKSYGVKK